MARDEAGEPCMVDGMSLTAASELSPDVHDPTDYQPLHEPVTVYRRFGRKDPQAETLPVEAEAAGPRTKEPFAETLRRQLATVDDAARAADAECRSYARVR